MKMADIVGDTPFNIDRIFRLIGSDSFYTHEIKIEIKDVFIDRAMGLINEQPLCTLFIPHPML